MHMHYAPTEKRLTQKDPMCGYVGTNDEICRDPDLCTCPECLDWIRPDHDAAKLAAGDTGVDHAKRD